MGQISLILIIIALIFSFNTTKSVTAQTVSPRADVAQAPSFPILPPVFSTYPLIPLGDLDNFEMSTLDQSTLGARTERRSNLTVNPLIERVVINNQQVEERTAGADSIPAEPEMELVPLPSRTTEKYYTWTDEDGVLHVTNDSDSVPSKYRSRVKVQR
ncbi:MAG TPA: hypothetical protein VHT73_13500 [Thermodesulfobacteriota bacterium]|nr:hypothetical protein [Thermodesulfobacteriota bacterium]